MANRTNSSIFGGIAASFLLQLYVTITSVLGYSLDVLGAPTRLSSGFYLPSADLGGYPFACSEFDGAGNCMSYHLGVDRKSPEGDPVYAVTDGEIAWYNAQVCGFLARLSPSLRGGAMVIKHRNSKRDYFYALYGHIKNPTKTSASVIAGEKVAEIGPFYTGEGEDYKVTGTACDGKSVTKSYRYYIPHLHFGINLGTAAPLRDLGQRRFLNF